MSTTLHLGTRKGHFAIEKNGKGWKVAHSSFLGVQVPMLLPDARDSKLHAAVEHGHFGTKIHTSSDSGATWEERACPTYPPKPEGTPDILCPMRQTPVPWNLEKIWSLEAGGADEPGVLWCGTIPGGLFKSTDGGASWNLVESLWNRPERAKWFGGGYDWPGIHSICVDPRNSKRVVLAISCGGVWETLDGGETWDRYGKGLVADFMPPGQRKIGIPRILTASTPVSPIPILSGCSIIAASTAPRTAATPGNALTTGTPPSSVSPWRCIRRSRRPRGSCPA